jgi:hypothetical protein
MSTVSMFGQNVPIASQLPAARCPLPAGRRVTQRQSAGNPDGRPRCGVWR